MTLSRLKVGDIITVSDERNSDGGNYPFYGINISKEFMPSVANTQNADKTKYKIVRYKRFVFSGMQTGRDNCIRISMYAEHNPILVSPAYTTFEITNSNVLPEYFFIIFQSKEMDRYGAFLSDSSVRANLDWNRFCNIELEIPSLDIQKKYVAIYESLLANLRSYEKGLEDLKLICDCYIENIKNTYTAKRIGEFIKNESVKNVDNLNLDIVGISKEQKLISSDSKTKGVDKKKYYILEPYHFVFSPIHINEGSIAYNDSNNRYLISPIYKTFTILNTSNLDTNYLSLWFSRKEFVRYCWFYAFGSARDTFDWQNLCDVIIPIPPLSVQKSISEIYKNYKMRKLQVEKIRQTLAVLCPVLVRGSILESRGKDVIV